MDHESPSSCNLTRNVTANLSSCLHSILTPSAPTVHPYHEFFKIAFGSAIYMIIVSFTTIVANGLLLVVFFFDPLKIFRNATTYFLIGLAIVDILTAATQQPMYATCFIMMYLRHPDTLATCMPLLTIGQTITLATWNASFLIVLAFTVTQYIAVISPLNHARKVTKTRVIICVVVIYLLSILFSVASSVGLDRTIGLIDQILLMVMTYLNIAVYMFMHIAFKKKMAASQNIREDKNQKKVERNFIIVNFLLIAILFLCIQPSVIATIVMFFPTIYPSNQATLISFLIVENSGYLKFLLDPFVYAWRIPRYRQALMIVLRRGREKPETKSTLGDRLVARMSKSHETVITLDFKNISPE